MAPWSRGTDADDKASTEVCSVYRRFAWVAPGEATAAGRQGGTAGWHLREPSVKARQMLVPR